MIIHCDSCDKELGTFMYGPGGVEEKAKIYGGTEISMPDVVCNQCWSEGYSTTYKKKTIH